MPVAAILLLIFIVLVVIAIPVTFEIGYRAGREHVLKKVATEIPQGLSKEQQEWVLHQTESRS
jgi:hypothetical protein